MSKNENSDLSENRRDAGTSPLGSIRFLRRRAGGTMNGRDFFPGNPRIHHVCPLLEHVLALIRILSLVVDGPDALLFMGQAFLNPVGIKSRLMQKR